MRAIWQGLDDERRALIVQLARYGATGVVVTLLAAGVYWVVATPLRVAPLLANFLSYLFAVALGYVLHSRFSFAGHGARSAGTRIRFAIVSLVSFGLNSLWVWTATHWLGGPTWWPIPAMVFVTPAIVFWLNRVWVFG